MRRLTLAPLLLALACATPDAADPALVRAAAIVDRALARRTWTLEDREELRGLVRKLPARESRRLFRKLLPAVNARRITVEFADLYVI